MSARPRPKPRPKPKVTSEPSTSATSLETSKTKSPAPNDDDLFLRHDPNRLVYSNKKSREKSPLRDVKYFDNDSDESPDSKRRKRELAPKRAKPLPSWTFQTRDPTVIDLDSDADSSEPEILEDDAFKYVPSAPLPKPKLRERSITPPPQHLRYQVGNQVHELLHNLYDIDDDRELSPEMDTQDAIQLLPELAAIQKDVRASSAAPEVDDNRSVDLHIKWIPHPTQSQPWESTLTPWNFNVPLNKPFGEIRRMLTGLPMTVQPILRSKNRRLFDGGTPASLIVGSKLEIQAMTKTTNQYFEERHQLPPSTHGSDAEDDHDDHGSSQEGSSAAVEKITLRLRTGPKDTRPTIVRVSPNTTIQAVIETFLNKIGRAGTQGVTLQIDGDDLEMDSTVADADLEDDDLVEVAGPAAWSALLPSLTPLAPATSVDSLVVTATNQPQIVKSSFVRDWFRIPNWALPTRALPEVSDDDDPPITLDAILAGRTKSPIRVDDLRAFLRNDEHTNVASGRALEFLLTYNSYRAAFFALPQEKQAPHPYAVLQGLSLANRAIEIQSKFRTPRSGRSRLSKELPLPPTAIAPHANSIQAYPQLDADCQPLRVELQNIIDLYLQPYSLSPIVPLVSHHTLSQALSSAKLTTHPSALDPVASRIHSHLTVDVLPRFLDNAVVNLSASTSRGRILIACISLAAAIVLEVFLILYRTGRAARLLALPLWILAIGYAIGSRTGLCFWLAWRGTREHKSYELTEPLLSSSPNKRTFGISPTRLASEPQRPVPLLFRFNIFKRARKADSSDMSGPPDSIAEKGQLPPSINLDVTVNKTRFSEESQQDTFDKHSLSSAETRDSFVPLLESKDGFVKKLMRLTGTAVDTIAVEDSGVRKLQARIGVRVAIWLILGTSVVTGVIMAIP
ncbi:unnamed protein product [Rhizoctonia solani]|uniref:Rad60/SUMO-like domain-containing protein n=1 Tax=Rhizoctonia solani TaxID=456999 RepID=A0A8H3C192_9AGAM|nr:unnamed protein product [Rhizoctonia solani]